MLKSISPFNVKVVHSLQFMLVTTNRTYDCREMNFYIYIYILVEKLLNWIQGRYPITSGITCCSSSYFDQNSTSSHFFKVRISANIRHSRTFVPEKKNELFKGRFFISTAIILTSFRTRLCLMF